MTTAAVAGFFSDYSLLATRYSLFPPIFICLPPRYIVRFTRPDGWPEVER